jgi:hypothetical protein
MKHSSATLPRTYSYNKFSLGNFHPSSFAIDITACRLKTADMITSKLPWYITSTTLRWNSKKHLYERRCGFFSSAKSKYRDILPRLRHVIACIRAQASQDPRVPVNEFGPRPTLNPAIGFSAPFASQTNVVVKTCEKSRRLDQSAKLQYLKLNSMF